MNENNVPVFLRDLSEKMQTEVINQIRRYSGNPRLIEALEADDDIIVGYYISNPDDFRVSR